MNRPRIIPDYSSPAVEQNRQEQLEAERREALEAYNESTFGDRHPFRSDFIRIATMGVVIALVDLFLPLPFGFRLTFLLILALSVWAIKHRLRS